jgi:hypothetical protein
MNLDLDQYSDEQRAVLELEISDINQELIRLRGLASQSAAEAGPLAQDILAAEGRHRKVSRALLAVQNIKARAQEGE